MKRSLATCALALCFYSSISAQSPPRLARSDVVAIAGYGDEKMYRDFGVTVEGWGIETAYFPDDAYLRRCFEIARKADVRLISANIDIICAHARAMAADPALRDATVRDIDGQRLILPWFSEVQIDGARMWYSCINHQVYRDYMKKKLLRNFALGASDAIHFDDPSGAAVFFQGGCFCDECIRLFREFLKTRYTTQQLADWNVEDVDRFDYREMVRTVAPDRQAFVERYRNARKSIPLMTVYEDFQNESWTRLFVQDVKHWAAKEVGRPIPLSANVVNFGPNYSRLYPLCDFFVAEIGHIDSRNYEWRGRKTGVSTDVVVTAGGLPGPTAILAHKLAEAMKRPLAATALPQDWRYLRERGAWDLLRLWIGLAYANGHQFMVPHSQWVFIEGQQEKKPYAPPRGETVPFYRFVRDHAFLFDGYEPVKQIGLVYSHSPEGSAPGVVGRICCALLDANIPHGVVLAGDGRVAPGWQDQDVGGYERLYLVEPWLDERIPREWSRRGTISPWESPEEVRKNVRPFVKIEGEERVWILPRQRKDGDALVMHLLNRDYSASSGDTIRPQQPFTIFLDRSLFRGRSPREMTLYAPGESKTTIAVNAVPEGFRMRIPRLDIWAILELLPEKRK